MNTTLHADFTAAAFPVFACPSNHFIQRQIIGRPTQIFAQLPFAKGAELAAEVADIGIVDVAVDRVRDDIAIDLLTQSIGCLADSREIGPARLEEAYNLLLAEILARSCLRDNLKNLRRDVLIGRGSSCNQTLFILRDRDIGPRRT